MARVRSLTGINSTSILTDADLKAFINEAYQEINREADWPYLRQETTLLTTPGTASYALPAGVAENNIASMVVLSNDGNRRQLKPRSRFTTDDSPGPRLTGKPREYSCWRGNVELYPAPNIGETITIRYYTELSDLVNTTDIPAMDAKFHSLLAYGASVRILVREGDETERRSYYLTQFMTGMDQMKGDLLAERDRSLLRLGGRGRVFARRRRDYGV